MQRRAFLRTGMAGFGAAGLSATPLSAAVRDVIPLFEPRRAQDGPVLLNSNENPLGLAPSAREAVVAGLDRANRYPDEEPLKTVLADRLGVPRDHLFFGAGSTEILRVAVEAWNAPGARLIYAEPTFEDVPSYAGPFAHDHVRVPLTPDYAHDLARMREEAESTPYPTIVYLCNPNNPTGTLTPSDAIDAWIEDADEGTYFLIDEAYFELADDPGYHTSIPWVRERANVLVVRTFSKVYAMAGMRLGYGIGHPATVARMSPFVTKNQPNHLAGVAALASLGDTEFYARSVATNREAKVILTSCLDDLGIEHLPSQTNFVMHRIRGELATYNARMAEAGFAVGRRFPPMTDWSRLSIGLPDDMGRFAETLRDFRRRDWI